MGQEVFRQSGSGQEGLFRDTIHRDAVGRDWSAVLIEEAGAEVCRATAVDDGATQSCGPFLQSETL